MTDRAELTLNEVVLLLRARNTNLSTRAANLLDAQAEVIEQQTLVADRLRVSCREDTAAQAAEIKKLTELLKTCSS